MCECQAPWSIYDGEFHFSDQESFYILGQCDHCGEVMKVFCEVVRLEVSEQ